MPNRKQLVKGIRSSVSEELLTYADGKLIPAEHYSDYTQAEHDQALAMTREEVYVVSLTAGLPRNARIEAEVDMAEVKRLLAAQSQS